MMIKYEIKDSIGILTLNRPEKRNALHPELVKQMKVKLSQIEKDGNVKVLIITGEGKSFCAGADLEYLNKLRDFSTLENEEDSKDLSELLLMIYNLPKPVIAAVNGAAIAGGCGLASTCDFIVADESNASFGYSEVKIGFIPAMVSTFLIRRVGEGIAKQMLLSADVITAKRSYEIGFTNYLSSNVLQFSMELASKLSKNSQNSTAMTKDLIRKVADLPVNEAVEYSVKLNAISRTTDDFKKGINHFLNKK